MSRYTEVDVFGSAPLLGNPLAVVHDADGWTTAEMAAFARWTNLSETTFLLQPTRPEADYRVRIFTPATELPFAGHPTLGSAKAWLDAGGQPAAQEIVQECGAGLVPVRPDGDLLAFQAPALTRHEPVEEATLARALQSLRVDPAQVVRSSWIVNGPHWLGIQLADAQAVLDLDPDFAAMGDLELAVVGAYAEGPLDVEVRAFCPKDGVAEDPVTGSANAGLAQWLVGAGVLPESYRAGQGRRVGRDGRIAVTTEEGRIWVGGSARVLVRGDTTW